MTFGGHAYGATDDDQLDRVAEAEGDALAATAAALAARGIESPTRSAGTTPTAHRLRPGTGITEMRPGNYVFYDATQVALGLVGPERCALTVLSTVVGRPDPHRIILDAGSKAMAAERRLPAPRALASCGDTRSCACNGCTSSTRSSPPRHPVTFRWGPGAAGAQPCLRGCQSAPPRDCGGSRGGRRRLDHRRCRARGLRLDEARRVLDLRGSVIGVPSRRRCRPGYQSSRVASSAPFAMVSSLAQATDGAVPRMPTNVPKPQSLAATTFSLPTTSAYRTRRCATSSGCSM